MSFTPHTQEQLRALRVLEGKRCKIEYLNKDYFNGEESVEKAEATAVLVEDKICFSAPDPYGMEHLIMQARVVGFVEH